MKIGICSWSNRRAVHKLVWPRIAEYCKMHGYRFETSSKSFDTSVESSWMKLKMLQQQDGLDYIVWMDDDIMSTSYWMNRELRCKK